MKHFLINTEELNSNGDTKQSFVINQYQFNRIMDIINEETDDKDKNE